MIQNKNEERYLLGYMMVNTDKISEILQKTKSDFLTEPKYIDIYNAIAELNKNGKIADFFNTHCFLYDNIGWYKNEGAGSVFLSNIVDEGLNPCVIDKCIDNLIDLYKTRKLNNLYKDLNNADFDKSKEIRAEIDKVYKECELNEQKESQMQKIIKQANDNIALYRQKGLAGWSWGSSYKWLNDMSGGLRQGKTYRIAGMSGAGKTSFIFEVLYNLLSQNAKVLFIEMESQDTIYFNLMSTIVGANPRRIENGTVKVDDEHILKFEDSLILLIDENNLDKIKSKIIETKPDVVILDYIGLVAIPGFDENTKYSEYADQIKMFVQNNQDICFIDLSNLPKSDNNEDMIRLNKGFNGSAKLRNNCDFGLHIFDHSGFVKYKKEMLYMGEVKDLLSTKVMTFLISKNRFGPDGVEKQYMINFNQGIRFKETSEQDLERFNSYK